MNSISMTTTIPPDEVLLRAVHFFANEKFTPTSQSDRAVTFQGKQHVSAVHLILTILGLIFCIVPGLILYFLLIKEAGKLRNIVVSVAPGLNWTTVTVTSEDYASDMVRRFMSGLPPAEAPPGQPLFTAPQQNPQNWPHGNPSTGGPVPYGGQSTGLGSSPQSQYVWCRNCGTNNQPNSVQCARCGSVF